MSLTVLRKRRGRAPTDIPPNPNVIATQTWRLASGSGTTQVAFTVTTLPGQFFAANIAQVSYWHNGTEIGIYAVPVGFNADNSAKGIWVAFPATLTNGVPVTGELRLTGGFTVARLSAPDMTAVFVNDASDYTTEGFPEGVIVASSAAHRCASSYIGKLRPQTGQPVFAGSTTFDTNWEGRYVTTILNTAPPPGSSYNGCTMLYHKSCRVDDYIGYIKTACSYWTRTRTGYLIPGSWQPVEAQGHWENVAFGALMMNDTFALSETLDRFTNNFNYIGAGYNSGGFWAHSDYEVRFHANRVSAHALTLMTKGRAYSVGGVTMETAAIAWAERMLTSPIRLAEPYWGGNNLGTDPIASADRSVIVFQNCLMMARLKTLMAHLPTSALHASINAACDATLDAFRTAGAANLSVAGTPQYIYAASNAVPRTWITPPDADPLRFTVDLNGFPAPLHAEKAARTGSVADANRARLLLATLGQSQGAGDGPFFANMKMMEEAAHSAQQTFYHLEQAGI